MEETPKEKCSDSPTATVEPDCNNHPPPNVSWNLPSLNVSMSSSPERDNEPLQFNILRDASVAIPKVVDDISNRQHDRSDEEIPAWKTSFRENFNSEEKSTTEDEIDEEEIRKLKSKNRLSNRVRRPVHNTFADKQV